MQGSSRQALAEAMDRLEAQVLPGPRGGAPKADAETMGDELLAVSSLLGGNPGLRRALTDPTRQADAKADLVRQLLGGKLHAPALDLVLELVRSRWSAPVDLVDSAEDLGVAAILATAQRENRLDDVEDELFRFARTVAGDTGLRDAFSHRTVGAERKSELVRALLAGRARPETVRLAVQAATAPRGQRMEQALERYLAAAARRRRQLVADVISAVPLSAAQRNRLAASLQRIYDREMHLNLTVDPEVIGGMRIQVEGELLDSTVLARLGRAKRALSR